MRGLKIRIMSPVLRQWRFVWPASASVRVGIRAEIACGFFANGPEAVLSNGSGNPKSGTGRCKRPCCHHPNLPRALSMQRAQLRILYAPPPLLIARALSRYCSAEVEVKRSEGVYWPLGAAVTFSANVLKNQKGVEGSQANVALVCV